MRGEEMKRKSKPKKKIIKYNKFFSYNCAERQNRNFSYKDFSYSNSYNTHFSNSVFFGNNFLKATIKYCGFNGCKFDFIEFKSTNFRGCRFKGAHFENVLFENCNLSNTHFQGATFKNVYLTNTSLKTAHGIKDTNLLININNHNLTLSLSSSVLAALEACKNNSFIVNSGTIFFTKKGRLSNSQKRKEKLLSKQERKKLQKERQIKMLNSSKQLTLHKVNILRLLNNYSEDEVAKGLHLAAQSIDKNFSSVSYFLPFIKKANHYT